MLMRKKIEEDEHNEALREKHNVATGKGNKKTRISGETLKSKLNSGQIPLV